METGDPILLILELHETLIYAAEEPLGREPDFVIGPYGVYRRPHLAEFLASCSAYFRLAVWSTLTAQYLRPVVARIMPTCVKPVFVWSRRQCQRWLDPRTLEGFDVKDLEKVERRGYRLDRVLITDATPRKVYRHHRNAVYVPPFLGDPGDEVLPRLCRFLISLRDMPNVRTPEKWGWAGGVR